jgi:hypothetical protein
MPTRWTRTEIVLCAILLACFFYVAIRMMIVGPPPGPGY